MFNSSIYSLTYSCIAQENNPTTIGAMQKKPSHAEIVSKQNYYNM
jgi:hypothetical protein